MPFAPVGEEPLFRRLVWTTIFRLGVVTILLGVTGFNQWTAGPEAKPVPFYGVVLATYLASLAYALVLRIRRGLHGLAFVQVALDVVLAAAVVSLTGRSDSPFVFMFSLATVNGAILLYRRGALAATVLALSVYLPIALWRVVPQPPVATLFVHGSAFAITALLSSYLAEQLRRTGERLAEREVDLAAITALHEAIVQSVASGLLTIDARGRVTFLNRAGEQITGLRHEDVRGAPASRWFSGLQPASGRGEADFENARGERLKLGYTLFALRGQGEAEIGKAVIFQDLTTLRAMEERVQRSERLAELGRVAAGLAHELRNPLASMTGSIELLRGSARLDVEDARLMEIVLREAARLNDLVSRFLEYSRPQPPRRERVDLALVATETLDVFAHDPVAARIVVRRALEPAHVRCDPGQARQVLWNLLVNAAQAMGADGGSIDVSCQPERGAGARLEVADDGPGISADDLSEIFRPFFTTKERGTGLGLAIVQRIVDAHGGAVTVESAPGQGSRFVVRFPAGEALVSAPGRSS